MARDVPSKRARFWAAVCPDAPKPPRFALRDLSLPLFIMALLVAVSASSPLVRFAAPVVLFALAMLTRRKSVVDPSSRRRGVMLDGEHLYFKAEASPASAVVTLREPFGLTLVKSPQHDRIVAVWSSNEGLFYVGTALDRSGRQTFGPLFDRAFTVLGDDAALEAIGPDGAPLDLEPMDFAALVLAVEEIDPACLRRLVLSDAKGAPFTLDGRELVVGERKFDLEAPIEWRPFVFQESFGQTVTVYQGTSIRQGASETVLVSLLPAIVPMEVANPADVDRSILRDLRLTQASQEEPPPRDGRVAIDRLFVLPVRSALDMAPRSNRQSSRARA